MPLGPAHTYVRMYACKMRLFARARLFARKRRIKFETVLNTRAEVVGVMHTVNSRLRSPTTCSPEREHERYGLHHSILFGLLVNGVEERRKHSLSSLF